MPKQSCSLCGSLVDGRALASPQKIENRILDLIKQDRPEWEAKRGICHNCLEQYRAKKFVATSRRSIRSCPTWSSRSCPKSRDAGA
jgi:hypothetical protein